MRTLLKIWAVFPAFTLPFVMSCSQEDIIITEKPEVSVESSTPTTQELRVIYQGKMYDAKYQMQNSERIYIDAEIDELMSELDNGTYSTLTYADGSIEYFNSVEELEKGIEKELSTTSQVDPGMMTKAIGSTELTVYDTKNCTGNWIRYRNQVSVPDLRNAYSTSPPFISTNFDDRISSFRFTASVTSVLPSTARSTKAVVTFYEDLSYQSTASAYTLDILTGITSMESGVPKKLNDEITSLKVYWTN